MASIVGLAAAIYDIGPYFGSWFYILVVILLFQKEDRWANLGFFLGLNALFFGVIAGPLWVGIMLAAIAFTVVIFSMKKLFRQASGAKISRGID